MVEMLKCFDGLKMQCLVVKSSMCWEMVETG